VHWADHEPTGGSWVRVQGGGDRVMVSSHAPTQVRADHGLDRDVVGS
jgi:hypothetical protein